MNGSRAWFEKDFYKVLGVGENASTDEIKRAYKKLARQFHPDRNPGNKDAEEKMKDISEAHDVLGDATKRAEYDRMRQMARAGYAGSPGGFNGGVHFEGEVPFDLGDLFGSMFGGGAGGARGARGFGGGGGRTRRGADLETTVTVSFEDAARGATIPVRVRRDAPCSTCNGTGDRSGQAQVCATCGGAGSVQENQGMFAFARACPTCGGSGRTITEPCGVCHGSGVRHTTDEVKVRIPAGIADGARIRVRGRGGAVAGGQTGDLYVVVHVAPHPVFGRRGNDLTLEVPIRYPDAVLGTKLEVPTLDAPVTLKIPAGTPSGKTFRVRGRGLATRKGTGDLLVTVQVEVPKKPTKEERKLIEELAALEENKV